MDVYFDFIESGSNIILGVEMVEDFETVLRETKEVKKAVDTNFYHWTLEAMEYALEYLLEEDVDEAVFKNQQRLVFDWLVNDNYKESYEPYYEEIKKMLFELVEAGGAFRYEVIKGTQNKAKKHLRKQVTKSGGSRGSGDLTGLFKGKESKEFKSTQNDVLVYFDKHRKQA